MARIRVLLPVLITGAFVASPASAQLEVAGDMLDNCSKIEGLREEEKLADARDAARLCLEGLEQELEGQVGQHFLDEVAGWTRTSFEQSKAMGFATTTARYRKDGKTVTVTLMGGAGGGSGLGALSSLAAMGMMQGGKQVRVAGLAATVGPDGTISVTLEDGSFLSFKCPDFDDADSALAGMGELVDQFPVAEINTTLKEG